MRKLSHIVSYIKTNCSGPNRHEASAGLDAVADAQRAVRDRPWPIWLYPINALLLGGLALAGLLDSSVLAMFGVIIRGVATVALNNGVGRVMGTPFAIPTSLGFRILAALSGVFIVAAVPARAAGLAWVVIVCAVPAAISYGAGSVLHYRSTHR